MKYDIETIMTEIKGIMTGNLNTRLAALDSEKGDAITLAQIDANAYFFQSLNGRTANYNPFVYYAVLGIEEGTEDHHSYSPTKLEAVAVVVFEDAGQDLDVGWRTLRYGRALKEIFEENFELPESRAKISVSSQVPVELQLLNSTALHRAIGVKLTVELG